MKQINHAGWKRVLLIIIPFILFTIVFQFLGLLMIILKNTFSGINLEESLGSLTTMDLAVLDNLILMTSSILGTLFLVWIFMRYIDKEKFINLGFHTKNKLTEFNYGILLGLVIMGIAYVVLHLKGDIVFNNINIDIGKIILSILLFTMVAISEEVLVRGYILKNLMISFNPYLALFLSSLFFSILHGLNPNLDIIGFVNIFLAGILLGLSYIYTKNLWFPISLHFSWNLFQALFGFNVSGQKSYSIIEFTILENNIINGGESGFEGSILCTIIMIIVIFIVNNYYKKSVSLI